MYSSDANTRVEKLMTLVGAVLAVAAGIGGAVFLGFSGHVTH